MAAGPPRNDVQPIIHIQRPLAEASTQAAAIISIRPADDGLAIALPPVAARESSLLAPLGLQRQKAIMPRRLVPTSRGGIGVEAGTCSLGKSGFRISTSVCIVTAAQLTNRACSPEDFECAATAQAARGATTGPRRARGHQTRLVLRRIAVRSDRGGAHSRQKSLNLFGASAGWPRHRASYTGTPRVPYAPRARGRRFCRSLYA
jgi:hypothetical protein